MRKVIALLVTLVTIGALAACQPDGTIAENDGRTKIAATDDTSGTCNPMTGEQDAHFRGFGAAADLQGTYTLRLNVSGITDADETKTKWNVLGTTTGQVQSGTGCKFVATFTTNDEAYLVEAQPYKSDGTTKTGDSWGSIINGSPQQCDAYPAFPDASCTGPFSPDNQLNTNCPTFITQSNTVLENCLWEDESVTAAPGVVDVMIKNSKVVNGTISPDYHTSWLYSDVEVGVYDKFGALKDYSDLTCIRCDLHHSPFPLYGDKSVVVDSYVHDLYGEGVCEPCTHMDGYGPVDGHGPTRLTHSTIIAKKSAVSPGGGTSCAICLYSHGTFWDDVDNVTIEKTFIASDGVFCMYGGNSLDDDPQNIVVRDNVFEEGNCAPITGWLRPADGGTGNTWTNNRLGSPTGTIIPEPETSTYGQ